MLTFIRMKSLDCGGQHTTETIAHISSLSAPVVVAIEGSKLWFLSGHIRRYTK